MILDFTKADRAAEGFHAGADAAEYQDELERQARAAVDWTNLLTPTAGCLMFWKRRARASVSCTP